MKVLYLSAALLPSEESHSLSIMRVCQALADEGHEVILSGWTRDEETRDPIPFYGLKGGFRVIRQALGGLAGLRISQALLLTGLVLAFRTRGLIREVDPDIIYSRLTIAELALAPRRIPIVYEMHSLGPLRGNPVRRWAFRRLIRRKTFRRIVVTTDALASLLETELPGIEVVVARLSAQRRVEVDADTLADFRNRELHGVERFDHHVGYTGYMDTYGLRGTDVVIRTAERMPEAAFHLVGGKPEVVEHWRAWAESYNRHENIFFYGHRNPSQMPLFLNSFDVVLAPLQYKPAPRAPIGQNMSPLKLPQYMAFARAIVASDLPAHRECLRHDETALLVPADDIDAWVNAIGGLIRAPARREAMGKAAHAAYEAGFSPEVRVKRILDGI